MAHLAGKDDAPTLSMDLEETGRSLRSSFRLPGSLSERSSSISSLRNSEDDEYQLQWAAIERLPTFERLRKSVFDPSKSESGVAEETEKRVVDVTKLGALERRLLVEKLIKHIENDNLRLLMKQKERIDRQSSIFSISSLTFIPEVLNQAF